MDAASLSASREILRTAYVRLRQLDTAERTPLIAEAIDTLDELCVRHTRMIAAIEPQQSLPGMVKIIPSRPADRVP